MTGGWKVGWGGPECSRPHLTDVPWHRGPVLCRGCGAKLNVGPVRQGAAFPLGRLDPALRAAAGSGGCDGGVKPCPAPRWCVSRARESAVFLLPGSFIAIRFTLRAIRPLKVPFAGSPHIPHCAAGTTTNVDRFRRRTRDAVPSSTQTRVPFPYAPLPRSVSPASLRDGRHGCGHAARSTQHFASDPSRIRVSPRLVQAAARTHTSFRLLTESWWLSNNLWFFSLSVSGCFPFFRIPKFFSWMKQPGEDVLALCVVVLNEASLLRGRTLYSRVPPLKVPFPRH